MNNKIIMIIFMSFFLLSLANAEDYQRIKSDSIFVVGVEWNKLSGTEYNAYVTVDLNYAQMMNPLNKYDIVETYDWNNWFKESFSIDDVGTIFEYIDEDGTTQSVLSLIYYYEIPDTGTIADCDNNWRCEEGAPDPRVGFYGLPFYIQEIEFFCDINDISKGHLYLSPDVTQSDTINLLRPSYEGISEPNVSLGISTIPLGWVTDSGKIVRYNKLPVNCENMDTTSNSKLYFKLRPNSFYRHTDPNIVSSETWEYSDIITSLPSITNKEELPFNLNIDFNFSGNFWDSTVTNEEQDEIINNLFGDSGNYDLDCIMHTDEFDREIKYSELTSTQKLNINTGETIVINSLFTIGDAEFFVDRGTVTCTYPVSQGVTNINQKLGNDITNSISFQQQKDVLLQLDSVDQQLATKKFVSNNIIPFFSIIIILIFYIFQLIILFVVLLLTIPLMVSQFIKGMKDAFNLDGLARPVKRRNK